ncbi:hypothetical protein EJB05_05977, partial [Eragrostis curvula]
MADSSKEEMARKAQKLAEESFSRGNVFGAQQWMLSAVKLAPDLPGNAHAVAAYDVHVAARRPAPDCWYAVLGLPDPRSDPGVLITHDAVKKQHRKLCLMVHPDKNASPAADGAFKLVQAAWDALSARHPPDPLLTTAAAAAAAVPTWPRAPPRPPDPAAPKPQQPTRRPQVVQMQRKPSTTSYSQPAPPPMVPNNTSTSQKAQSAPQKQQQQQQQRARRQMSPPPARPPSPPRAGMCPNCGASTSSYGKTNFRCMSCQWSPMDGRHDEDYDDDYYY